jgi:hypothetical protein
MSRHGGIANGFAKFAACRLPDDGLVDAANVALLLGQPLLLTGELRQ